MFANLIESSPTSNQSAGQVFSRWRFMLRSGLVPLKPDGR